MILHIIPDEKWTKPYIDKINCMFGKEKHSFLLFSKGESLINDLKTDDYQNVFWSVGNVFSNKKASMLIENSNIIVIHSLFFPVSDLKKLSEIDEKKLIWFIWGGDLYDTYLAYKKRPYHISSLIREIYRRKFFSKIDYVIANDGDYRVFCSWYKTKAKKLFAQYTYNLIDKSEISHKNTTDGKIRVLVGHSATRTCRHLDVFEKLSSFKDKITVISPLSYPSDIKYIDKVKKIGYEIFGDSFIPITEFMDYKEYIKLLSSIDIGVFANNRQQGNGNIISLLYLGKKIYISPENNLYQMYKEMGAYVFAYPEDVDEMFVHRLSGDEADNNERVIQKQFSDETFYTLWSEVFSV